MVFLAIDPAEEGLLGQAEGAARKFPFVRRFSLSVQLLESHEQATQVVLVVLRIGDIHQHTGLRPLAYRDRARFVENCFGSRDGGTDTVTARHAAQSYRSQSQKERNDQDDHEELDQAEASVESFLG